MNWYKLAQSKSKSLPEMLQSLQSDYDVDPNTLDWIRSLPDREASVVIRNLLSNPSIPLERLKGFVSRSQRDRTKYQESFNPLTPDMETYVTNQGEFADWLKYNLLSRKGEDREKLFQHIRENMGFVADWYNMGFQDEPESRPKLDGNLPFERAVLLSKRWHDRQEKGKSTEYEPMDPRNIIKKYPNGWTWQKITSENDAIAEGNIMKHCLRESGHCEAIRLGKEIPYSLRDENNKPKVTTTFKYQHVLLDEAKGYDNADPAPYIQYLKDLFAIFKPIYSKEGYLSGKLDELGMKDWDMLKPEDVETDPFLQKVVNNAIIRGDEIFSAAEDWAKNKLHSGKAPDEWIMGINRYIKKRGKAPYFAWEWAKKQIESRQMPQEWIDVVSHYIKESGWAPNFAHDWAEKQMESGQPEQWLIDATDAVIKKYGDAPKFAKNWAKEKMDSGQAPQEWIDVVNRYIKKYEDAPGFAEDWAKKQIESGQAPQEWDDVVSKYIQDKGYPQRFADNWANIKLYLGQAPQWLVDIVSKRIHELGRAPSYVRNWVISQMYLGQPEQWLIDAVNEYINVHKKVPYFAREWYRKQGR